MLDSKNTRQKKEQTAKILDKDKHPALKYGCDNEHLAKAGYIAYKGHTVPFTVFDVGSISKHRFSWFSGSLDGLIWRENQQEVGVLEIKCIYSCRNKLRIDNKSCAFLNKEGKLREKDPYWLQIQLYAWLTNATFAHLWLWTANDQRLINVPLKPDEAQEAIKRLEVIYFEKLLPNLSGAANTPRTS